MKDYCLDVSGPYACFTRPEMKVERVSYDVITPSVARAIFESILWKPAIRWNIKRIEVLAPIRWVSVRRNEIGKTVSPRTDGFFIEDNRQQRAGLFLQNVRYRLYADFEYIPPDKRIINCNPLPHYLINAEVTADLANMESPAKYAAMFERRAKKGQCFNQPYLGCREFAAAFRLVDPEKDQAVPWYDEPIMDLGWMLYDLDYSDLNSPKPLFFKAIMERGVINTDRSTIEVRG